MYTLVLVVHFVACFLLIVAVLMQSGKGNAMGVFGGAGAGEAVFGGGSGASFIKRFTLTMAIAIACTSVGLTFLGGRRSVSVMEKYGRAEMPTLPQPAAKPAEQPAADAKAAPAKAEAAKPAAPAVQKVAIPEKKAK